MHQPADGDGNVIHPTAILEGDVRLGRNNVIGPQTILQGPVTIGDDNWITAAAIGLPPQHRTWWLDQQTDPFGVVIGDRNVIREYVTVHSGLEEPTRLGNDCYLMATVHVGHDVQIGDGVTLSVATVLGGHCHIDAGANLGLSVVVHQRLHIGQGAMVGMNSTVTADVPRFATSFGSPARVKGINRTYLELMGWSNGAIDAAAAELAAGSAADAGL